MGPVGAVEAVPSDARVDHCEQDHGEQSRQSVRLALKESGDDSFVVVAAVENGVHHCDRENAVPGSAKDDSEQ
jgi:hypothetical protein